MLHLCSALAVNAGLHAVDVLVAVCSLPDAQESFLSQREIKMRCLLKDCVERIVLIFQFYSRCCLQCFCQVEPNSTAALALPELKRKTVNISPILITEGFDYVLS